MYFQEKKYNDLYDGVNDITIIGRVESEIKYNEYNSSCVLNVDELNGDKRFKNTNIILKFSKNQHIEYGDIISVKGNFSSISGYRNKGVFQYRDYLKTKWIFGNVEASKIESIGNKKDIGYFRYKISFYIEKKIDSDFEGDERNVIKGILLGDKENLSDDLVEKFQISGISHILAVSGAHVACIVIGINFICDFFLKSINLKRLFIVFFLSIFVFVIGFTPSVLRAFFMTGFILISKLIHRKSNIYINLIFSSFIILLYNPYYLVNSGFLLSFFATFGIVYMYKKYRFKSKCKILNYIVNIILVSVYANLFIIPIMIKFYNQVSVIFIFCNLIISPIMLIIEIFGLLFILAPNFISSIISFFISLLLKIIILTVEFGSNIPFAKFWIITPSVVEIVLYYCLIFYFTIRRGRWRYKFIIVFLIIIVVVNNVCFIVFKPFTISFIDVGQGDSCLIQTRSNKVILVDGGGLENYDIGKNVLLPYLLNKRIWKIDYIIVSHFDFDHVGGLFTVIDEMKVENIIISKQVEMSENFERFKEILESKKIKVLVIEKGERIEIDNDTYFDFLWPDSSKFVSENGLNNNSIVCKLNYMNFSMLFTGDIEEKAERQILREYKDDLSVFNSTVLKVAHHGSKSSSTDDFLKAVSPRISLIGVGKNNKFGHPNVEIIQRLERVRM
ncbi:MAG: DNA internalization-related competence protein ComEC/Rec2 [Clostridia bacterium]|nr:DNA internalization-related competence protein ComEC/Rec2 [Clostridia bacterium]